MEGVSQKDILEKNLINNKENIGKSKIKKLYKDGMNLLCKIQTKDGIELYDIVNTREKFSVWKDKSNANNFESSAQRGIANLVFDQAFIPNGTDKIISGADTFVPYTQYEFPYSSKNCGPTTIFNLIKLAEHRGVSMCIKITNDELFNSICSHLDFDGTGGISNGDLYRGLKAVVKNINVKVKVNEYLFDAWSDYERDINAGKSIAVNARVSGEDGHAMTAVGYRIAGKEKCLRVITNWSQHTKSYILFKKSNFAYFESGSVVFEAIS